MGSHGTSRVAARIRPSLNDGLIRTKRARGLSHPVHPHHFLRKRFSYPSIYYAISRKGNTNAHYNDVYNFIDFKRVFNISYGSIKKTI